MVEGFLVGKMNMMLGTTRSRQIRQQYRLPYAGVAEDILVTDVRVARDGDMAYERPETETWRISGVFFSSHQKLSLSDVCCRCVMVNNNRSTNFGDESVS
ncbi:unnamed protein product [Lactuca virosa]|uniref:Uncharacterized protein n=1 Tax=Lactuca virosa TaxID=75947 RepID=A0AAU9N991_9ASTR|nr:unnamed protein product [Lactuca virosa]